MNEYRKLKLKQLLSDEQQGRAYFTKSHTAVIAGPGSGKTSILTLKTLKLLENDIAEPQGIGCITYSREAAREIRDRLQLLGYKTHGNSFFGTVHAFCIAEVLVPFSKLYNHFAIPMPIRIASTNDRNRVFEETLKALRFERREVSMIEMNRERKISIVGQSKINVPSYDIALQVALKYEELLHNEKLIDFDDIVNYSTILIQREKFVKNCLEAKFPWLLIDEYQDLGKPLHEIVLSLLISTNIKIFAVGDPDQSIYGFQGAIPAYLEELASLDKIEGIVLEQNYRSNQDIVDASEIVLEQNRGYIASTRKEERAVFQFYVCEEEMEDQYSLLIDTLIPQFLSKGIIYDEMAVLMGTNYEVSCLAEHLRINSIPFYISRHNFERTDLIQWLENCAKWTIEEVRFSFDDLFNDWWKFLQNNDVNHKESIIEERIKLFSLLRDSNENKEDFKSWLILVLNGLSIKRILKNNPLLPDELENVKQLIKTVEKNADHFNLKSFAELGRPKEQITIATRHSSKGLEFEVVIMLGMEEDRFPSYYAKMNPEELIESSRLCFVCISRAKRICVLVRSKIHTINTRRGPWTKPYLQSRYWNLLENWQKSNRM